MVTIHRFIYSMKISFYLNFGQNFRKIVGIADYNCLGFTISVL